jgi:hypothetical protein
MEIKPPDLHAREGKEYLRREKSKFKINQATAPIATRPRCSSPSGRERRVPMD